MPALCRDCLSEITLPAGASAAAARASRGIPNYFLSIAHMELRALCVVENETTPH